MIRIAGFLNYWIVHGDCADYVDGMGDVNPLCRPSYFQG